MAVEFFDHTADIGARVIARSVDALFADAALALTTTLIDPSSVESRLNRDVALQAQDFGQLLVDWLSELVGWFDIDQIPCTVGRAQDQRTGCRVGSRGDRSWGNP